MFTSPRFVVARTDKILLAVSTFIGEVVVVTSEIRASDPSTSQKLTLKLPHVFGVIATAPREASFDQGMFN